MAIEQHTLFETCRIVAEATGFSLKELPPRRIDDKLLGEELDIVAHIEQFAEDNDFRLRIVSIANASWSSDLGPMLGFKGPNRLPVALIPHGRKGFICQDLIHNQTVPVTDKLINTLADRVYVFYPPLKNEHISSWDLLTIGFRGAKPDVRKLIGMGIFGGLLGWVAPIVNAMIFNNVIPNNDYHLLLQIIVALLILIAAGTAFHYVKTLAILRLSTKTSSVMQAALCDRLLRLPLAFINQYKLGDLAQRVMGVNTIQQRLDVMVIDTVITAVFAMSSLLLLFYFSASMAWVACLFALLIVSILLYSGRKQLALARIAEHSRGKLSGLNMQVFTNMVKLRLGGAEHIAYKRWLKDYSHLKYHNYKYGVYRNIVTTSSNFIVGFAALIFFLLVIKTQATIPIGNLIAFLTAFGLFSFAIANLANILTNVIEIIPIFERLKPILQAAPEGTAINIKPGQLEGSIRVVNVAFRYDENSPLVLQDIDFTIGPKEYVAIVGESGCGKTTLFRLLLGLNNPDKGHIFYNDLDLEHLDHKELRKQLGVVLQTGKLMVANIYQNIDVGGVLTLDQAWEIARKAGVAELIESLPMKMHTTVMEGAESFSGGQRQQLLIARALARDPKILLFDEATSALDNKTQNKISACLDKLDVTRIVIAHRLSTIVNSDRIFVMDQGRIVQEGRYQDLMNQPGKFQEMAKRQIV